MTNLLRSAVIGLAASVHLPAQTPAALRPATPIDLPPGVEVFVGIGSKAEERLVQAIRSARNEILLSQYALTNPILIRELADAFRARKIFVGIVLEPRPAVRNYMTPAVLSNANIPVILSNTPGGGYNNSKFWIFDRKTLVTGSFDATQQATRNWENILVITEPGVVTAYYNAWIAQASAGSLFSSVAETIRQNANPTNP